MWSTFNVKHVQCEARVILNVKWNLIIKCFTLNVKWRKSLNSLNLLKWRKPLPYPYWNEESLLSGQIKALGYFVGNNRKTLTKRLCRGSPALVRKHYRIILFKMAILHTKRTKNGILSFCTCKMKSHYQMLYLECEMKNAVIWTNQSLIFHIRGSQSSYSWVSRNLIK